MEFCELSLRSHVGLGSLCGFLATALRIDRDHVGEEPEYWDRLGTDHQLAVGVGIRWSDLGYKTFLKWVQEAEVPSPQLLTIALVAAKQFGTEVAIGDVLAPPEAQSGRFLVAKPDGSVYQAVELCNGDLFELTVNPSPIDTEEIRRVLT